MDNILNVFEDDAFSVVNMTARINDEPFIPGRAGAVINWEEDNITTTSIGIEIDATGSLNIVDPTPRGGPGWTVKKEGPSMKLLKVPHYQIDDGVMADEVLGRRVFGGGNNDLMTVQALVDKRMSQHVRLRMDPTLEYQRMGALRGKILNGNGSTLYDLFVEFGVTEEAPINFDLNNVSPAMGALRQVATDVGRLMAQKMQGLPFTGIHAFVGDEFYDKLVNSPEVRETYLAQQDGAEMRRAHFYDTFAFGQIVFENYRGQIGDSRWIADDEARFFPVGTPGFWRTVYAPADYVETVNTPGLPRYSKQWPMHNGKGVHMEVQMNPLNFPLRPGALLTGKVNI